MLRKCLDGDNNYAELVSPYSNKNTWKTPCRCSIINEFSRKSSQTDVGMGENDRKLFCHNDFFNYMNSRKVLTTKSIDFESKSTSYNSFTSIATLDYSANSIILILSTLNARILMLKHDLLNNVAVKYDEVNLLKSLEKFSFHSTTPLLYSASNINLAVIDTSKTNNTTLHPKRTLFVTYDRFLFKINLQNCEQFETCESCLGIGENQMRSSNPFCGWCVYEQKCMLKHTCSKKTVIGEYLKFYKWDIFQRRIYLFFKK